MPGKRGRQEGIGWRRWGPKEPLFHSHGGEKLLASLAKGGKEKKNRDLKGQRGSGDKDT